MNILFLLLIGSLLFPLIHSFRCSSLNERLLCYVSISTRAAISLILFSRLQEDPMLAVVAVVVLSMGNSGLMFLVNLIKGMEDGCD
jgi:multicomponent Na+:H+ antiporter subunit F